ncbi:hypothetical protein [Photobacterium lutimaris]|uniref:Uncharacterized protein n=1 Tax=Photobacterium lutimaris TaxID=388278 RepID=A0A2T3J1N6_9GAMM|nr:hypothetical protein [Photobacterium lutimaris]PSU34992.1 hypothetical protein C9I99_07955 [Photobacterium lutimaris]TDR77348.1 hypothetical protein DFP78_102365 [Photobacterium lutimaris]
MKKIALIIVGLFIANSAVAYELQGRNDISQITPQKVEYQPSSYVPTSKELQGQSDRTHFPKLKTKFTKSEYKPSFDDIKGRS